MNGMQTESVSTNRKPARDLGATRTHRVRHRSLTTTRRSSNRLGTTTVFRRVPCDIARSQICTKAQYTGPCSRCLPEHTASWRCSTRQIACVTPHPHLNTCHRQHRFTYPAHPGTRWTQAIGHAPRLTTFGLVMGATYTTRYTVSFLPEARATGSCHFCTTMCARKPFIIGWQKCRWCDRPSPSIAVLDGTGRTRRWGRAS